MYFNFLEKLAVRSEDFRNILQKQFYIMFLTELERMRLHRKHTTVE